MWRVEIRSQYRDISSHNKKIFPHTIVSRGQQAYQEVFGTDVTLGLVT